MATWRSAIATHIIDPVGWKLKRTDVGRRLAEFRRLQWESTGSWRRRQEALLARLLSHAVTRIPNRRPTAPLEGYTEALFALAEFVEREGLVVTPAPSRRSSKRASTQLPLAASNQVRPWRCLGTGAACLQRVPPLDVVAASTLVAPD